MSQLSVANYPNAQLVNVVGLDAAGNVRTASVNLSASSMRQVATRCYLPSNFYATNKQIRCRAAHKMRVAVTSLKLLFPNFYVDNTASTYAELGSGAAASLTAAIEYPEGVFTAIKFAGATTGSIPNNGMLLSDAVAVTIPKDAVFWVRTFYTSSGGIVYMSNAMNTSLGESSDVGPSGTVFDNTMGGSYLGNGNPYSYTALAIIGLSAQPCALLIGDSRTYGVDGDSQDGSGDGGEVARSIGRNYGYVNCGIPGDRADKFVASHTNRVALASYFSHVIVSYGINDIFNSRTATQISTDLTSIAGYYTGNTVIGCTVSPHSSSTDSYATVANQTTNATTNGIRVPLNRAIRCVLSGYEGCFDLADQVESGRDTGIWKAGYTSDGIHGNITANLAIKSSQEISSIGDYV